MRFPSYGQNIVDTSGTSVTPSFNSEFLNSLNYGGSGNNYNASLMPPASAAPAGLDGWSGGGIGNRLGGGLPFLSTGGGGGTENWAQRIGLLGGKDGAGWGGLALGGIQGAANLFMGMKQYGMAKDSLAQAKEIHERNFAAQKTTTNSSLEDRQRARVASSPGAYVGVDEYMSKNGIK